jgi:DNA repair protein RecO (recombination protein O)
VLCPDCRYSQSSVYPLSVNALKVFRLMQTSDYSTVNRLKINPELSRELKLIMRYYIRYLLEKDLRSADWMDELAEQR